MCAYSLEAYKAHYLVPSYRRHPSNLMLDRLSGKILHIDFGDCFEVILTSECKMRNLATLIFHDVMLFDI